MADLRVQRQKVLYSCPTGGTGGDITMVVIETLDVPGHHPNTGPMLPVNDLAIPRSTTKILSNSLIFT
ncbi:Hypothetical predicted protein [Pelobates cultripes]|uniref:Uncharacterized protein n=1 Tax=Pelobates cultripes TaxID=61616 RepID=A0AAD1R0N5_PELCU|nr:Hypothetical predicted protein [Pelobates cultripes]